MADAEGTETTQIEGATKPLEKEKIETIDEEQSTGILLFRCLAFSSRLLKLFLFQRRFLRREMDL